MSVNQVNTIVYLMIPRVQTRPVASLVAVQWDLQEILSQTQQEVAKVKHKHIACLSKQQERREISSFSFSTHIYLSRPTLKQWSGVVISIEHISVTDYYRHGLKTISLPLLWCTGKKIKNSTSSRTRGPGFSNLTVLYLIIWLHSRSDLSLSYALCLTSLMHWFRYRRVSIGSAQMCI